jgi:cell wall-associated NlpC family hydrolase
VTSTQALRERVAREAQRLVGTPYHHQGRNPAGGVDCSGLVIASVNATGGAIPVPANYPSPPRPDTIAKHIEPYVEPEPIAFADRQPGDLLLLRLPLAPGRSRYRHNWPEHLAVVDEALGMVHSLKGRGVIRHRIGHTDLRQLLQVRRLSELVWQPLH